MSDSELANSPASQLSPLADSPSTQTGKLDLSKYQSKELVAQLVDLLNVGNAFATAAKTTCLAVLAAGIAYGTLAWLAESTGLLWLVFGGYSLLVGLVFGFVLGILRIIYGGLANVEGILTITLENCDRAVLDLSSLRSGATAMPSGSQLITQMYEEVLMPCIEQAVSESFGLLGHPIILAYKWTVGSAVRRIIVLTAIKTKSEADIKKMQDDFVDELNSKASNTAGTKRFLQIAKSTVGTIGKGVRYYAMRPLFTIFLILMTLAVLPVLVFMFLF